MLFLLVLPEEYLNYYAVAAIPTCQLHYGCELGSCKGGPSAEHAGENTVWGAGNLVSQGR